MVIKFPINIPNITVVVHTPNIKNTPNIVMDKIVAPTQY